MCRWFAYISPTEPCLIEDVLVTPAHSLTKQVHDHYLPKLLSHNPSSHAEPTTEAEITTRNRLFNVDGFGMAWYTPTHSTFTPDSESTSKTPTLYPAIYKSTQPPIHDPNFRSLSQNTSSLALFAHIRAATSTAITNTNCHPFTFGIYTIMHNGYISDFAKIKRDMCSLTTEESYAVIQGGTDTEHFAALLISFLFPADTARTQISMSSPITDQTENSWTTPLPLPTILSALRKTISAIIGLQKKVLGDKAQPNDLNIAITTGRTLLTCRFRNHATEQPPSLYYSTTAGVTLNRQFPDHPDGTKSPDGVAKDDKSKGHNPHARRSEGEHGKHVIVASEPSTYKATEWTLIEKNHVVFVGEDGDLKYQELGVAF